MKECTASKAPKVKIQKAIVKEAHRIIKQKKAIHHTRIKLETKKNIAAIKAAKDLKITMDKTE
jgi:hypothetical protein